MRGGQRKLGSFLRKASLACLVLQNTALVLLLRYSRIRAGVPMYLTSTAVALGEVIKLVCAFVMIYVGVGDWGAFVKKVQREVIAKPMEIGKLAVPSLLYTLQNNLLFTALSHLDAAVYSVTYQLKILTTALFSVWLLGRHLSRLKWASLVVLSIGVVIAEASTREGLPLPSNQGEAGDVLDPLGGDGVSADALAGADLGIEPEESGQNRALGFACVLCAACTSGFAGAYFERILKGSSTSLWIRNVQMGCSSVVLGFISVFVKDWSTVLELGMFHGYSSLVVLVVILQAVGGLVVAVVVKYADNILKSFGTAISIVFSCVLSMMIFGFRPGRYFGVAVVLVNLSVFMYSRPDEAPKKRHPKPKATVEPPV
ncbi:unnamed protein product [Chrysoparadoxa australica]